MRKITLRKSMPFVLIAIFSIVFIDSNTRAENLTDVEYKTVNVEGIDIFKISMLSN